uniref:Uncharacterized protein n=1 Tax=Alexandrium catenella TaxID=2925 RepID=A0A7S1QX91_ALECA|mmetsp:Transcript_40272/g.108821  ORF Transcript_40272/g.108821 Transcript_40272/m.108821 type:complete len:140 (+) Transcript_40272:91-510(+)
MGRSAKMVRMPAFEKQKRQDREQDWRPSKWKEGRKQDKEQKKIAREDLARKEAEAAKVAPAGILAARQRLGGASAKRVSFGEDPAGKTAAADADMGDAQAAAAVASVGGEPGDAAPGEAGSASGVPKKGKKKKAKAKAK